MLQLSLNSDSSLPLVDQIVGGIRSHIDDRLLRAGMRLPPIQASPNSTPSAASRSSKPTTAWSPSAT